MIILSANNTRAANLSSVLARDVDMTFVISSSKVTAGDSLYLYGVVRRVDTSEYRAKVRIAPNRSVYAQINRVSNGAEAGLGNEVQVQSITYQPNMMLRVRFQAVGINPTTLRVKVWAADQNEPLSWQFSTTDSTVSLQTSGVVGLRAYLGGTTTNGPVTLSFDDLLVNRVP